MARGVYSSSNYFSWSGPALHNSGVFTVAAWVYKTSTANGAIFHGAFDDNHRLFRCQGGNIQTRSTNGVDSTTSAFPLNTWFHAAGVFGPVQHQAFLNGVGSTPTNGTNTSTSYGFIGNRRATNLANSTGQIAELAIWLEALSQEEIASLAAGFSAKRIRPHALITAPRLITGIDDPKGTGWSENGTVPVALHPRVYS